MKTTLDSPELLASSAEKANRAKGIGRLTPRVGGAMETRADTLDDPVDVSLLEDSLAKTPWERMQANDDALRFADSLHAAMERLNAKSKRPDA